MPGRLAGRRVFRGRSNFFGYVGEFDGDEFLDVQLGVSLYLHSTATGKLFAAFDEALAAQVLAGKLPRLTASTLTDPRKLQKEFARIREAGHSRSDQEAMDGVVGYAVPIRDGTGSVVAAVHVSVLATRATPAHERAMLPAARLYYTLIAYEDRGGTQAVYAHPPESLARAAPSQAQSWRKVKSCW